MKFVDEYRDPESVRRIAASIARVAQRPWTIMEVCGGQTHAIVKFGIDELLPPEITLTESIRVRCRGKVVRVDGASSNGKLAVAAVIDEYEFLSDSQA